LQSVVQSRGVAHAILTFKQQRPPRREPVSRCVIRASARPPAPVARARGENERPSATAAGWPTPRASPAVYTSRGRSAQATRPPRSHTCPPVDGGGGRARARRTSVRPSVRPRRGGRGRKATPTRPGPASRDGERGGKRPPSDARAACAPLVGRPPPPPGKARTLAYPPRKREKATARHDRPAGPGRATLSQSPASTSRPEHTCSRIKQTKPPWLVTMMVLMIPGR
jgi:hypothetical protein